MIIGYKADGKERVGKEAVRKNVEKGEASACAKEAHSKSRGLDQTILTPRGVR